MKALVLSGGSGSRLRPITHTSAKQLVPVANKPVLFYGLEAIADAGITEVGMVVGDTEPAIRAAVGDGSAFGLTVTCLRQEAPLGLAHAVLIAREFLGGEDFVMYLGDNFIVGGITGLVEEFRAGRPDAQIMLTKVADPRQFGVAELDDAGEVAGLEEKPDRPKSDLALVGVYICCVIADSEIEYSIVLAGASIRGVRRVEASLIGHHVEATPAPRVPRAHRLVLGDHSKVQISS
jgi:glucose-1-phosphate thymidylyltransferase